MKKKTVLKVFKKYNNWRLENNMNPLSNSRFNDKIETLFKYEINEKCMTKVFFEDKHTFEIKNWVTQKYIYDKLINSCHHKEHKLKIKVENKKVYGVGINDKKEPIVYIGSDGKTKFVKSYEVWKGIIQRTNSVDFKRKNKSYIGCVIDEGWKRYSIFKRWFDKNYRYDLEEMGLRIELDKDLLCDGVIKIYSSKTCVFLPSVVNGYMASDLKSKTFKRNKKGLFDVFTMDFNKRVNIKIGSFENIEDAKMSYFNERSRQDEKVCKYLKELGYDDKICNAFINKMRAKNEKEILKKPYDNKN